MSIWFKLADQFLLIGVPLIFAGLLVWATATPGNPPVGLAIGWAADATWLGIGSFTAWRLYWKKR